jgi:hypothetical protein
MNKILAAAFVALSLFGCSSPPARGPKDDPTAQEMAIVMAVGVQETSQLKVGQWALYSVRSTGATSTASTRLAVVGAEGGNFWIENRTTAPGETGRPRTLVWKYLIDSTGKPLKVWVAEPPGKPAEVPMSAHRTPAPPDPRSNVDIAKERVTISTTGKVFECTRLTSKTTYPDGRATTLTTWCSEDVPFSAVHDGKSYGGVVRRTYGPHTLELTAKGIDAVPEITLPEK